MAVLFLSFCNCECIYSALYAYSEIQLFFLDGISYGLHEMIIKSKRFIGHSFLVGTSIFKSCFKLIGSTGILYILRCVLSVFTFWNSRTARNKTRGSLMCLDCFSEHSAIQEKVKVLSQAFSAGWENRNTLLGLLSRRGLI